MSIERLDVMIATTDGQMPTLVYIPADLTPRPAILLLMEAFGITPHIQDVATRIANEGYVVLIPDLYYRQLPNNKFGYDEVEKAMAMMWSLDFGKPMEADLQASLSYLKSRSDVQPGKIGVTGFCLGGGLSFLTACKFSDRIVLAAPFYGMVFDEWIEAVTDITVPIYLFFGGIDPFIPINRINQVESRFKALDKEFSLKVYPDATHGFFCNDRNSYNRAAAEDSWHELIQFFHKYL